MLRFLTFTHLHANCMHHGFHLATATLPALPKPARHLPKKARSNHFVIDEFRAQRHKPFFHTLIVFSDGINNTLINLPRVRCRPNHACMLIMYRYPWPTPAHKRLKFVTVISSNYYKDIQTGSEAVSAFFTYVVESARDFEDAGFWIGRGSE